MPVSRKEPERMPETATVAAGEPRGGGHLYGSGNGSTTAIDPEMVARLAHSYRQARGCVGGSPEEDWLRASKSCPARLPKRLRIENL